MPEIPDKQYFKIGEVARILEVKPSVLRFWEQEFPSVRPEKSAANQRVYGRKHVERLLAIKDLLYGQKFTIAGARRRLREPGEPNESRSAETERAEATARTRRLLIKVEREIEELLRLASE